VEQVPVTRRAKTGVGGRVEAKPDSLDTPVDAEARRRLGTLIDLSAEQHGIQRVLNYLAERTGASFDVKWTALEAAGVSRDTPVSARVARVPARRAMELVLAHAGGGAANLGYTIEEGVVVVSTRDDLNSTAYQKVVVYDIRDLLVVQQSRRPEGYTRDDAVREIVDTIKSVVAPETWRDNGGQIGNVRELNGQLIVNQTREHHASVARLLEEFRVTLGTGKKKR
jgi:hypothetical protein